MIANQIFGRQRNGDAALAEPPFEFLDFFDIFLVGMSQQDVDEDSARGRFDQRLLNFEPIHPIDDNFNTPPSLFNSLKQRIYPVAWLNNELHLEELGIED
jgi:hypothetical protein